MSNYVEYYKSLFALGEIKPEMACANLRIALDEANKAYIRLEERFEEADKDRTELMRANSSYAKKLGENRSGLICNSCGAYMKSRYTKKGTHIAICTCGAEYTVVLRKAIRTI